MQINRTQTARNLAKYISENGSHIDEMYCLYDYGFDGFRRMTDSEIQSFVDEEVQTLLADESCLNKDDENYPHIIVYEKEN